MEVLLDNEQFNMLVSELADNNWDQFIISASLTVLLTLAVGWWVPRAFRKADERKLLESDVRSANFGIAYHGAILESLICYVESLVLIELTNDNNFMLSLKSRLNSSVITIRGIPEIKPVDVEKYIKHFPLISEKASILLAISRMAESVEQFNLATRERTNLAIQFAQKDSELDKDLAIRKFNQILQRTQLMTYAMDVAVDAALFITDSLNALQNRLIRNLRKKNCKGLNVSVLLDNKTYFDTLEKLRKIVDGDQDYSRRYKHFDLTKPRPTKPKAFQKARGVRSIKLKFAKKHVPSLYRLQRFIWWRMKNR